MTKKLKELLSRRFAFEVFVPAFPGPQYHRSYRSQSMARAGDKLNSQGTEPHKRAAEIFEVLRQGLRRPMTTPPSL